MPGLEQHLSPLAIGRCESVAASVYETNCTPFPHLPSNTFATRFGRILVRWFERHHRDFPWRRTRDPYAIWVSEVMLQQTQAVTVVPYFERFLQRFPNVVSLAQAPVEEVLRLWQGLGYYRRALSLHRSAVQLLEQFGGQFPRDPELLLRLPGIGRYTAHAILSQAFDLPLPIVEANSARVYARVFACSEPTSLPTVQRWLWQVAERLLPVRCPGVFNQAVMELGAVVCLPRNPRCGDCPLAKMCLAGQLGQAERFPVPAKRRSPIRLSEVAVVVHRRDRWLVLRRAAQAERWPLLWEFPRGQQLASESPTQAAQRVVHELTGLRTKTLCPLGQLRYGVTRFRVVVSVWWAEVFQAHVKLTPLHVEARWLKLPQIESLPASTPQRRILALLHNPQARRPRMERKESS